MIRSVVPIVLIVCVLQIQNVENAPTPDFSDFLKKSKEVIVDTLDPFEWLHKKSHSRSMSFEGGPDSHDARLVADVAPATSFASSSASSGSFGGAQSSAGSFSGAQSSAGSFSGAQSSAGSFTGAKSSAGSFAVPGSASQSGSFSSSFSSGSNGGHESTLNQGSESSDLLSNSNFANHGDESLSKYKHLNGGVKGIKTGSGFGFGSSNSGSFSQSNGGGSNIQSGLQLGAGAPSRVISSSDSSQLENNNFGSMSQGSFSQSTGSSGLTHHGDESLTNYEKLNVDGIKRIKGGSGYGFTSSNSGSFSQSNGGSNIQSGLQSGAGTPSSISSSDSSQLGNNNFGSVSQSSLQTQTDKLINTHGTKEGSGNLISTTTYESSVPVGDFRSNTIGSSIDTTGAKTYEIDGSKQAGQGDEMVLIIEEGKIQNNGQPQYPYQTGVKQSFTENEFANGVYVPAKADKVIVVIEEVKADSPIQQTTGLSSGANTITSISKNSDFNQSNGFKTGTTNVIPATGNNYYSSNTVSTSKDISYQQPSSVVNTDTGNSGYYQSTGSNLGIKSSFPVKQSSGSYYSSTGFGSGVNTADITNKNTGYYQSTADTTGTNNGYTQYANSKPAGTSYGQSGYYYTPSYTGSYNVGSQPSTGYNTGSYQTEANKYYQGTYLQNAPSSYITSGIYDKTSTYRGYQQKPYYTQSTTGTSQQSGYYPTYTGTNGQNYYSGTNSGLYQGSVNTGSEATYGSTSHGTDSYHTGLNSDSVGNYNGYTNNYGSHIVPSTIVEPKPTGHHFTAHVIQAFKPIGPFTPKPQITSVITSQETIGTVNAPQPAVTYTQEQQKVVEIPIIETPVKNQGFEQSSSFGASEQSSNTNRGFGTTTSNTQITQGGVSTTIQKQPEITYDSTHSTFNNMPTQGIQTGSSFVTGTQGSSLDTSSNTNGQQSTTIIQDRQKVVGIPTSNVGSQELGQTISTGTIRKPIIPNIEFGSISSNTQSISPVVTQPAAVYEVTDTQVSSMDTSGNTNGQQSTTIIQDQQKVVGIPTSNVGSQELGQTISTSTIRKPIIPNIEFGSISSNTQSISPVVTQPAAVYEVTEISEVNVNQRPQKTPVIDTTFGTSTGLQSQTGQNQLTSTLQSTGINKDNSKIIENMGQTGGTYNVVKPQLSGSPTRIVKPSINVESPGIFAGSKLDSASGSQTTSVSGSQSSSSSGSQSSSISGSQSVTNTGPQIFESSNIETDDSQVLEPIAPFVNQKPEKVIISPVQTTDGAKIAISGSKSFSSSKSESFSQSQSSSFSSSSTVTGNNGSGSTVVAPSDLRIGDTSARVIGAGNIGNFGLESGSSPLVSNGQSHQVDNHRNQAHLNAPLTTGDSSEVSDVELVNEPQIATGGDSHKGTKTVSFSGSSSSSASSSQSSSYSGSFSKSISGSGALLSGSDADQLALLKSHSGAFASGLPHLGQLTAAQSFAGSQAGAFSSSSAHSGSIHLPLDTGSSESFTKSISAGGK